MFAKEEPTDQQIDMVTNLREKFTSSLSDRGTQFWFIWADANLQDTWVEAFEVDKFPQVVALRAGKTKKYMKLATDEVSEENISNLLDSIIGGNGRFTKVKGNKLPSLKNKE
jgi:hypothetical protein